MTTQSIPFEELVALAKSKGAVSGKDADASVLQEDGEETGEEEPENEEEVLDELDQVETQPAPVLPVSESEPTEKLGRSTPYAKKLNLLEKQVAEMAETIGLMKDELDLLRGRTDRLQGESAAVRRQLGKQANDELMRGLGRIKSQLEEHIRRGHR